MNTYIEKKINSRWFRINTQTGENIELAADYVCTIDPEFKKEYDAKIASLKAYLSRPWYKKFI